MDRVQPLVEAEGEPPNKPQRRGEPLAFYQRPCSLGSAFHVALSAWT